MQLSLKTDYALRIMLMLGATGARATIDQIADRYRISRNHLAKVVQALQNEGLIETTRGRGGGLRLAREPGEINLGDVVRRLERFEGFVSCMGGLEAECSIDGACRLKPALAGALDAFLAHLDGFTLEDLLRGQRKGLLEKLAIAPTESAAHPVRRTAQTLN